MVADLKLGDWYFTVDNYGDAAGYLFVARQGQFIIGTPEDTMYQRRIVDQLHEMCEESLDGESVDLYIHYANKCYMTLEEAEEGLLMKMDNEYDMLKGNINRMLLTKDIKELNEQFQWVVHRTVKIYAMKHKELEAAEAAQNGVVEKSETVPVQTG